MTFDEFIARWTASGDAERANKDSFLNELCDVLGVERPHPKTGDPARDLYVFEKDVPRSRAGAATIGWVDLYKSGSFLLEAKQRSATGPKRRDLGDGGAHVSPGGNKPFVTGARAGEAADPERRMPILEELDYCFGCGSGS
jgi:hypothetical protein